MHIISRDPAPPSISYIRTSGGIFMDMMIHDFDMARFLIGDEVKSCTRREAYWRSPKSARRAIWIWRS